MKPGSNVNTPCSLVRLEMSSTSGPMVPGLAFSRVVFPVARFLSSYFVLMRFPDGDGVWFLLHFAPFHGCTSESRERVLGARSYARGARLGSAGPTMGGRNAVGLSPLGRSWV